MEKEEKPKRKERKFKTRYYKLLDNLNYKLNFMHPSKDESNQKVYEIFVDFNIYDLKLKEHFMDENMSVMTKAAENFFYGIKKYLEKEIPNTLIIFNHPKVFAKNSPEVSDFMIQVVHYYPQGLEYDYTNYTNFFKRHAEPNLAIAYRVAEYTRNAVKNLYC